MPDRSRITPGCPSSPIRKLLKLWAAACFAIFCGGCAHPLHAQSPPAATAPIRLGSKVFTESVILGEITAQVLRAKGLPAEHRAELGGTQILWQALQSGEIDLYVDYTGTIREEILRGKLARNEDQMRLALSDLGVVMTSRLGFNNTYALGMPAEKADKLGIVTISDLAKHPDLRFGFSDEFVDRRDGWKSLVERYKLPQKNVRTMDHSLAYRGLEKNAIDLTDLYSTDAEIDYFNLRVLEDDLGFFPTYYAVILYRRDLAKRHPAAITALGLLGGAIETGAMVEMNSRVRIDRKSEAETAREFVTKRLGLTPPPDPTAGGSETAKITARLARTTGEHLYLVAISLAAAIAAAIPLGVVSAKSPAVGRIVLTLISIIQTLPSMALLVFMIPLLGLGPTPAIVALFLYSLLPIVRNTHGGLTQIPSNLRESAEVLGLSAGVRLRRIELPLAMPSILAGIKTAAVINVGTATIGALIGAGGYGAPILTGIRLSDVSLILQGAIPAAVLALLVQGLFTLLEHYLIPQGLRLQAKG